MPSPRGEGGSKTRMRWREGITLLQTKQHPAALGVGFPIPCHSVTPCKGDDFFVTQKNVASEEATSSETKEPSPLLLVLTNSGSIASGTTYLPSAITIIASFTFRKGTISSATRTSCIAGAITIFTPVRHFNTSYILLIKSIHQFATLVTDHMSITVAITFTYFLCSPTFRTLKSDYFFITPKNRHNSS